MISSRVIVVRSFIHLLQWLSVKTCGDSSSFWGELRYYAFLKGAVMCEEGHYPLKSCWANACLYVCKCIYVTEKPKVEVLLELLAPNWMAPMTIRMLVAMGASSWSLLWPIHTRQMSSHTRARTDFLKPTVLFPSRVWSTPLHSLLVLLCISSSSPLIASPIPLPLLHSGSLLTPHVCSLMGITTFLAN